MATGTLYDVRIKGIACAVPDNSIPACFYYEAFGKENVDKFVRMTGVEKRHVAGSRKQCASDLCFAAARALLDKIGWEAGTIGALIFVSQSPDYRLPATACILQHRLGLSENCMAFDINLGCSGYIYGICTAASIIAAQGVNRVLLLTGDASNSRVSPRDKATAMLFGDGGSATAIEKTEGSDIKYLLRTRGSGFKNIIIPAGGCRNMDTASPEMKTDEDGSQKTDYDLHMDGSAVFNFTICEVPKAISELMRSCNICTEAVDAFVFHQANLLMLKHIAKKIQVPFDKVPVSMDRYGNTSSASIPITLVDQYGGSDSEEVLHLLLSGFGVGLSWGCLSLELTKSSCLPMIFTNEFYEDGGLP